MITDLIGSTGGFLPRISFVILNTGQKCIGGVGALFFARITIENCDGTSEGAIFIDTGFVFTTCFKDVPSVTGRTCDRIADHEGGIAFIALGLSGGTFDITPKSDAGIRGFVADHVGATVIRRPKFEAWIVIELATVTDLFVGTFCGILRTFIDAAANTCMGFFVTVLVFAAACGKAPMGAAVFLVVFNARHEFCAAAFDITQVTGIHASLNASVGAWITDHIVSTIDRLAPSAASIIVRHTDLNMRTIAFLVIRFTGVRTRVILDRFFVTIFSCAGIVTVIVLTCVVVCLTTVVSDARLMGTTVPVFTERDGFIRTGNQAAGCQDG